ncbi:hypothetical protein OIU77_022478 [Salix suchowensis]|uniref:Protein HEADING DATE REPRESSOR 1 n=1 Tax=Salix suchowensis TaxID=1278906 RepID=A0ABQ9C415_9ROSI|nr:hypothetical protein OIU77_022478 [Salix suchowensis]
MLMKHQTNRRNLAMMKRCWDQNLAPELSERRKALFEPLEPVTDINGKRSSAESLLPPPDFDAASYPKGWLIGKKRKLVNVDVVESMRRIAVQEMNRKDREINGLNEQLEEDARCLEHLQLQLLQEKSRRAEVCWGRLEELIHEHIRGPVQIFVEGPVTVFVEMVGAYARLLLFAVVSPSYLVNSHRSLLICSCVDASWLTISRSIMWQAILLPFCCALNSDSSFAGYFDRKFCLAHFISRFPVNGLLPP